MNHVHRSLGALTPGQVSETNAQIEQLAARLTRQHAILRDAATAGVDSALIARLRGTHAQLMVQLQSLTDTAPSLSSTAFAEWVARATGVETQVSAFEAQVQGAVPGAERARVTRIALSTVGALALAGGIAALLWYGSKK